MAKTSKELICEAEQILFRVYQEDIFGVGTKEDVVKEQDVSLVEQFCKDIDAYVLLLPKGSTTHQRLSQNDWILNGRRVSVRRIQNIIDILRTL